MSHSYFEVWRPGVNGAVILEAINQQIAVDFAQQWFRQNKGEICEISEVPHIRKTKK